MITEAEVVGYLKEAKVGELRSLVSQLEDEHRKNGTGSIRGPR